MGKRSSQRKSSAMLESDDDSSCSSMNSFSTVWPEKPSVLSGDEVQVHKDVLLDQALDDLYEKRGSTREKALASIIDAFNSELQHAFLEKKFATLLHQCLTCIKKGSSKEISLASHAIGLLALTSGNEENSHEILEESLAPLSQALKTGFDSSKIPSLLECLAVVTFVGGTDPEETEKSMEIIWQKIHPKLGSNVVVVKPPPAVITSVISTWAFLLTTVDQWMVSPKLWQETVAYLSTLLDKEDRSVRIAAGEALALIFEMGSLEKFAAEAKRFDNGAVQEGRTSKEVVHMQGLKAKIVDQIKALSVEAGVKGSSKKDLNSQRNLFKDVLEFLEDGYSPESTTKIGGDSLQTSTWSQMIQLNFLKHFLGGGFVKHMQENEFLHDVFGFTPKKKFVSGGESYMSPIDKRMFRSPNSALNKARTQFLNKQRMLSQSKNGGYLAAMVDDDA